LPRFEFSNRKNPIFTSHNSGLAGLFCVFQIVFFHHNFPSQPHIKDKVTLVHMAGGGHDQNRNPFYAIDLELFDFHQYRFSFGETTEEAIRKRKSKDYCTGFSSIA
jgi:hypothetical protein